MAASVGTARLEVRELETTLRAPWGMRRRHRSAFRLGPLSFDVAPGEAVAVLGPNGAGKTTLLRLLGGIYRPSSGQVEIDGRTSPVIGTWPPFDPDLTVAEHLRSWSALLGGRLDAQAALSFAGLRELETQPVRWLSAGQRVRLGMAPGLLSSCDVYLIDEALAVCDPEFRAQAIDLLRARCESGVTLILAGQDLLTARALCERGLCLDRGRLAMDGELDQAIAAFTVGGGAATDAMATGSVVIEEVTAGPAPTGEPIPIRVRVRGATRPFQLLVAVKDNAGRLFHSSRTVFESSAAAPSGAESLQVVVPPGGLPAGRYRVAVSVVGIDQVPLATRDDATVFEIG